MDELDKGLILEIKSIVEKAKRKIAISVNNEMVLAYWNIGRTIVDYEQGGESPVAWQGRKAPIPFLNGVSWGGIAKSPSRFRPIGMFRPDVEDAVFVVPRVKGYFNHGFWLRIINVCTICLRCGIC